MRLSLKKTALFSLALLFVPGTGVGDPATDSLRLAYRSALSDSERVAILLEMADASLETNPKEAKEVLEELERVVRSHASPRWRAALSLRYGRYCSFVGQFKKAAQLYDEAIRLAESVGDSSTVESAVNNIAVLHMRLRNFEEGIAAFERLLRMARARGDSEAVTQYLLNLGLACAERGDSLRAEHLLRQAVRRGLRNSFYRAVATNSLSYLNNSAGRFREAERFARQALAAHPEKRSLLLYVQALTNLGKALVGQKRFAEARSVLERAVKLAEENQFEHELAGGLWNLAAAYEGAGQYVAALRALRRYSNTRDTLLTHENARQINELRVKYETEKKEHEVALRTQQLRMAKMRLRFALLLAALALGSVVVVANLYRKRTIAYRELVKRNLELVRSERRISDLEKRAAGSSLAGMSDQTRARLVRELDRVFREERLYLSPDLSLEKLAAQAGVSSRYLSQVVREHYGMSFPALVNNLRISEARRMLADEKYRHYSIEGIARSVGFSSKSAFNVAFKKITGLTPSFFRESAEKVKDGDSSSG